MQRRQFLKTTAATGAGWLILPSDLLSGQLCKLYEQSLTQVQSDEGATVAERPIALC